MPFYAVAKGRKEGIYTTWAECEQQVKQFSGAIFKKFPSLSEATDFLIKHEANILRKGQEKESWEKGFQQSCVLQTTLANTVSENPISPSIKEEPLSTSLLYNDNDGDKELVRYFNVAVAATGRMTRNIGDIEAAIEAIEIAIRVGIPKLCLHTKSEFLLNAVAFWMNIWKRHGWRNKAGKVVQNRKQFEKLYTLINESDIDIKWADARNDSGTSNWRQVQKLAEIGTEDYLDLHPSKEDASTMEYFDDFVY
nr:ribonuclease H1-like [Bactrocera oleae]